MLVASRIAILALIGMCGVNQAQAQQWTNSGSNIFNNNTGNVGVGTSTPTFKLDVLGNINTGGALCIQGDCKFSWAQAVGVPNQWQTALGGASIYYSGGNVGIGMTSPGAKLDVAGIIRGGMSDTNIGNHPVYGQTYSGFWRQGADYSLLTDGIQTYLNAPTSTGNIYFRAANADKMFLQGSTGRLGIGTITPGYKLDVNGEINATGIRINGTPISTGAASQWTTSGTQIYYTGGNVGIGNTNPLSNLQIGTQTAGATATPVSLSLGGTYSNTAGANIKLKIFDDGIAADTYGIGVSNASLDFVVSPTAGYNWYSGGAGKMTLTGTGNLGVGTNAPSTKLHVVGDGKVTGNLTVDTGNLGVGITTPTSKLHVVGDAKITGNLTVDGNIAAKYQDLAEYVESSQRLVAGTVVVLDSVRSNQVIASTQAYDSRVAGVISLTPGVALGEPGESRVLVATTGRVRVKVDATNGPIQIGDLLVTSDKEGVAMKSMPVELGGVKIHRPGTLIGKALEPLAKGTGEILVLLSLQ